MSQCLELLGLQEFATQLEDHGFDRLNDILCLDDKDFALLLIPDEEIKTRYKTALQQGNNTQVSLSHLSCLWVREFSKLFETITVLSGVP